MQPLVFFFVVAAINVGVCQKCALNWQLFQGQCYRYGDTAVSWFDAQVICQSQGGRLAEIPSFAANDFLTTIARHKRDLCVWFGGSDIIQEGVWEWSSGLNSFYSFRNWHSGEPNSDKNTEEDCLNMLQPLNYNWNDAPCNFNCNFICTKPAREAPSHAA
ncbi:hypothetical protein BsWGS_11924 [Bradybaena similaris]